MTTRDPPVLTITQATNAIKHCIESSFPLIWLQGEISNFKMQSSGHLYFSLKDAKAQISAVMFRGDASSLKQIPKDGDNVIVRGEINVYPATGKYQILIRELRPVGLGELLQKLEELKIKLLKRGWFRPEHKKPIPKLPKIIGVVTSPTGAVIQDILNVLSRRFPGFRVIINPVKVQGEGAAQEIALAINQFNEHNLVDVMIIGRGGGSIEDLWAFNEEIVAEAIFNSRIPIISAVGHETDHCIADYVADIRAPTPSAAAEIVIAEKAQLLKHLKQSQSRIEQALLNLVRQDRHRLQGIKKQPLLLSPYALLGPSMQRLDDIRSDLDQIITQSIMKRRLTIDGRQRNLQSLKPTTQIAHFRQKLSYWDKSIRAAMLSKTTLLKKILPEKAETLATAFRAKQDNRGRLLDELGKRKQLDQNENRFLKLRKERLESISAILHSIDPKNVLKKGYCILFSEKDNSVITSIQAVEMQQDIRLVLSNGELLSTIKEIIPK